MKVVVTHNIGPDDSIQLVSDEHSYFADCMEDIKYLIACFEGKESFWYTVRSALPDE